MWRATHNETYRSWGWQIFRAFEMHAKRATPGYASLESVTEMPVRHRDAMESFFLAETLKYLLLLFSDDQVRGNNLLAFEL
jgi:endoplasmic reticulum Man9GlcNAc2 1,2-alpha-mannosidase